MNNPADNAEKESRQSQADELVRIAQKDAYVFHDDHAGVYATILEGGKQETLTLRSTRFSSWLSAQFYKRFGKVPGGQAKGDAISVLEGRAQHEGPNERVHLRFAEQDGVIFIDLANEAREIVHVTANGWSIEPNAPVRFLRPEGMRPLPRPERGGSVDELRPFLNLETDGQFILFVSWIVAAQKPRGPFPILALIAEHGAAKTTCSRIARALVDPNRSPIRSPPRELRDLAVAASASHVLAYDNLSGVPIWLSDALCRVATGGGFSTRSLYTNNEEQIFDFVRPIIVNGIDNIAERSDFADRCLVLDLPAIPQEKRQRERVLMRDFEVRSGRIYGAILDGLAAAIRSEDGVDLHGLPRMADFAVFATAAEDGLGFPPESFLRAYEQNQTDAVSVAIETDVVAASIIALLEQQKSWFGTSTDLLDKLESMATERQIRGPHWPKGANALGNRLRRVTPILRTRGINVERRKSGSRTLLLTRTEQSPLGPSAPSGLPSPPDGSADTADGDVVDLRPRRNGEPSHGPSDDVTSVSADLDDLDGPDDPGAGCASQTDTTSESTWPTVSYAELSEFQRDIFRMTGSLYGMHVVGPPV
jgi:hypothetical protein